MRRVTVVSKLSVALWGSALLVACAGEQAEEANVVEASEDRVAEAPTGASAAPGANAPAADTAETEVAAEPSEPAPEGQADKGSSGPVIKLPQASDFEEFTMDSPPLDPKTGAIIEDIWQPAATPRVGVSWSTLEATKETTRLDEEGYIISKPQFAASVKELEGTRITVAGWMMPYKPGVKQDHFILLGYPPGCPFHFHAAPNQFIEVYADIAFPTNEIDVQTVSGVLELTGYDESGIFYRLRNAKPV